MTANERLRRLAAFAREHKIELLIIGGVDGGTSQNCALLSDFALGSTADDIVLLVRSDKIMLHASALTLEDVRARISVPADVFCNPAPVGSVDGEAALDFKLEAVRKMLAASPGCVVPTADGGLSAAADAAAEFCPLLRAAFEGGSLVRLTRLKDVHAWVTSRHAAYSIPGVLEKKPMDAALAASY